ncbi:MAG: site-specific integrase [Betaproteobacteria bacterium]|nr:site-specific integrase [Betaproteobacteria bacterium]
MASIRKRGDYSWEAQIRRLGFPTQTKTFIYRADAEEWARGVESEMDRGVFMHRSESEKVTIGDLIDRYKREVTPSKKNSKSETEILDRLKEKFGAYALVAIQAKNVAVYRDGLLEAGKAASTVNHYLNTLSGVISQAMKEWGYPLPTNPVANVKRPAPPPGRDRRLLPGEEKRILRECRRYKNPVLEPMVRLALETAARQGELFSLKWEDVDLTKRVAHFRGKDGGTTKNDDAFRAVPLSPEAVRILQTLKPTGKVQRLPRGPVFNANIAATRIAFTRAIERAKERYVAACERIRRQPDSHYLVDLVFHDLRHEATSRLFERGVFDMMEVASITGHKTLSMLKRYTHLRAEDLAKKLG